MRTGRGMQYLEIDDTDRALIAAASRVLEENYCDPRHTVGAAVRCKSGRTYAAVNVESCGYGPCAEPIAIGCAISNKERSLERLVAVGGRQEPHNIMSPCGNCRQLLLEYAPECMVIISHNERPVKVRAKDLLPDSYSLF